MNDRQTGRGKNWKQGSASKHTRTEKYGQLVFAGLVICIFVGLIVWLLWPREDSRTRVFVLAVEANPDVQAVPFQQNDLNAIANSFGDHVQRETFNDPISFKQALTRWVESVQDLNQNDTVLLYVSGHGYVVEVNGKRQPVILTTDYRAGNPITPDRSAAVSIDTLLQEISGVQVNNILILLDTCSLVQNPADGTFANDFTFALHNKLKVWESSRKGQKIWLITAASMLEIPAVVQAEERSLFSKAIQSVLMFDYDRSTLRKGLSVHDFYSMVYSFVKIRGGKFTQSPLLYCAGTGVVTDPSAVPEINQSTALFPIAGNVSADQDFTASVRNETDTPKVTLAMFQESSPPKKATDQDGSAEKGSVTETPSSVDPVQKWIAEQLNRRVLSKFQPDSKLGRLEQQIRAEFANYFFLRFRLREYFQVYEVASWFPADETVTLHDRLKELMNQVAASSILFGSDEHVVSSATLEKLRRQRVDLLELEDRFRIQLNETLEQLFRSSLIVKQTFLFFAGHLQIIRNPELGKSANLTPLVLDLEPLESAKEIDLKWSAIDPWNVKSLNWRNHSNRMALAFEILKIYPQNRTRASQVQAGIKRYVPVLPTTSADLGDNLTMQLAANGDLLKRTADNSDSEKLIQLLYDRTVRQELDSVAELFPEFHDKNWLTSLSFKKPAKAEMISLENVPQEFRVERSGAHLNFSIRAEGDQLEKVQVEFSFADPQAPFEVKGGMKQSVDVRGKTTIPFQLDLKALKDDSGTGKSAYDLFVKVTGISKSSKTHKTTLQLPFPDQVDLSIARKGVNGLTRLVETVESEEALTVFTFPNRKDIMQIGLANRFHRGRKIRISIFPCAERDQRILPEKIDEEIKELTRKGILDGTVMEFRAAIVELSPAESGSKADQYQWIQLLKPDDPLLAASLEKPAEPSDKKPAPPSNKTESDPKSSLNSSCKNGFLIRVADLKNSETTWDFWIGVFPLYPNYVAAIPGFKNRNISLDLSRKAGDFPGEIEVKWRLVNARKEKLLIDKEKTLLTADPQSLTLIRDIDPLTLEGARLFIDVDGWPRRFIYDFKSDSFRERKDLKEIRMTKLAVPAEGPKEGPPKDVFVKLPNNKPVTFGFRTGKERPVALEATFEVDTSTAEHFRPGTRSEIMISPGPQLNSSWRLNFPRQIDNQMSSNPAGLLELQSIVSDFNGLPLFVTGDKISIEPRLKLAMGERSTEYPQPKTMVILDKQPPKFSLIRMVDDSIRQGERLKIAVQCQDLGVGISPEEGFTFYSSDTRILGVEGLKPMAIQSVSNVDGTLVFSFAPAKDQGSFFIAVAAIDRVGNSVFANKSPTLGESMKFQVLPMATTPKPADTFDLTVAVQVGSVKLGPSHKNPKVTLKPEDAVGQKSGDKYLFKGLKKGVKYSITGETRLGLGGKATGTRTILHPPTGDKKLTTVLKLTPN